MSEGRIVVEFSLLSCTSMAHAEILRLGENYFVTQAQIAANNPTYTLKDPHSSQSQKLNLRWGGWMKCFKGKRGKSLILLRARNTAPYDSYGKYYPSL